MAEARNAMGKMDNGDGAPIAPTVFQEAVE